MNTKSNIWLLLVVNLKSLLSIPKMSYRWFYACYFCHLHVWTDLLRSIILFNCFKLLWNQPSVCSIRVSWISSKNFNTLCFKFTSALIAKCQRIISKHFTFFKFTIRQLPAKRIKICIISFSLTINCYTHTNW